MKTMIIIPFYEQKGILVKYFYHFIFFGKIHFSLHYRNDFAPANKEILDQVSEKLVDCMRKTTLSLD